jgi:hypothetical protein
MTIGDIDHRGCAATSTSATWSREVGDQAKISTDSYPGAWGSPHSIGSRIAPKQSRLEERLKLVYRIKST